MAGYAHPEVLVETGWVADHNDDPNIRIVEVDVDTTAYEKGHVPGAIGWNWTTHLATRCAATSSRGPFERLMARPASATTHRHPLWRQQQLVRRLGALAVQVYGHKDVRLMNGGRKKWLGGPPADHRRAEPGAREYALPARTTLRAYRAEVMDASANRTKALVDVRSPTSSPARSSPRPA